MARTVLFFGDSNTRGAGVGREARAAARLEKELAEVTSPPWRFAVSHSVSDFKIFPGRLEYALTKYEPDVVVLQCPTGPATYWINYPWWMKRLTDFSAESFRWLTERFVRAEEKQNPPGRTRKETFYEAKFLDSLYRWNVAQWPGPKHVRRLFAKRYGTIVKASGPRYVVHMGRLRDQIRERRPDAKILVLGLIPSSEDYYPGYRDRAVEFGKLLEAELHRPEEGIQYVDLHGFLTSRARTRDVLVRDGRHLSAKGHELVAEAVAPHLRALLTADEEPAPPQIPSEGDEGPRERRGA